MADPTFAIQRRNKIGLRMDNLASAIPVDTHSWPELANPDAAIHC